MLIEGSSLWHMFTVPIIDFHPPFTATRIFTLEGIQHLMHTSNFQHNLHVFPFIPHYVYGAAFVGCSETFGINLQWNKSLDKNNP